MPSRWPVRSSRGFTASEFTEIDLRATTSAGGLLHRRIPVTRCEGARMPKTQFTVHTTLSPNDVLGLLTDFGPDRPDKWPHIDDAHFTVHELGASTADVTEG